MRVILMSDELSDSGANAIDEWLLWDLADQTMIDVGVKILQDIVRYSAGEDAVAEPYIGLSVEILLRVEAELIVL